MARMNRPRQFSLAYLFWEIFWIALSLGCATQAFRLADTNAIKWFFLFLAILFAGAAIGGIFGRTAVGMMAAIFLVPLVFVFFTVFLEIIRPI